MKDKYVEKRKRVNLSLSDQEHELFLRHADKKGEKLSAFIKKLAFSQLKKQNKYIPTDEEQQSLNDLVNNLRAIGNNINQVAHVANVHKRSSTINFIKLRKQVADAENLIREFFSRKI